MRLVMFVGANSGMSAPREAALREWARGRDMEVVVFEDKTEALRQIPLLLPGDIFVGVFFELSFDDYRDHNALFKWVQWAGDRVPWGSGVMLFDSTAWPELMQQVNEEMANYGKAVRLIDHQATAEDAFAKLDDIATLLVQNANNP